MKADDGRHRADNEISLSLVSQNVTSTKLNLFGPAVSECSMRSLKKQLVTSLKRTLWPVDSLFAVVFPLACAICKKRTLWPVESLFAAVCPLACAISKKRTLRPIESLFAAVCPLACAICKKRTSCTIQVLFVAIW